jgi:hypothetical protein
LATRDFTKVLVRLLFFLVFRVFVSVNRPDTKLSRRAHDQYRGEIASKTSGVTWRDDDWH